MVLPKICEVAVMVDRGSRVALQSSLWDGLSISLARTLDHRINLGDALAT